MVEQDLRLLIVEGTGENRTVFVDALRKEGVEVVRGIPHQNGQNEDLTPEAQKLLAGVNLNFDYCLNLSPAEGQDSMRKVIKTTSLQFMRAITIAQTQALEKTRGITVLDRGITSIIAQCDLFTLVAMEHGNVPLAQWGFEMADKVRNFSALAGIRGIVLIDETVAPTQDEFNLEIAEAYFLKRDIQDIKKNQGIRILEISPEEAGQRSSVEKFYRLAGVTVPEPVTI